MGPCIVSARFLFILPRAAFIAWAPQGSSPPPLAVLTLPMLGEDPAHVGNEEATFPYNPSTDPGLGFLSLELLEGHYDVIKG